MKVAEYMLECRGCSVIAGLSVHNQHCGGMYFKIIYALFYKMEELG